jgi:hypothetical protein
LVPARKPLLEFKSEIDIFYYQRFFWKFKQENIFALKSHKDNFVRFFSDQKKIF